MTTTPSPEIAATSDAPDAPDAPSAPGAPGAEQAQAPAAPAPRTTVPGRTPLPPGVVEQPRRPGSVKPAQRFAVWGSLAGSLGLTSLLFQYLLPLSGAVGFVVVAWFCYLGLYGLVVSLEEDGQTVRDRLVSAVVHSLAGLVLLGLISTIVYACAGGWHALPHLNFYWKDLSDADALTPLSVGGVANGIVGTLEQISIALVITVPLGVATALFLNEVPGAFTRFVRTVSEAMTALPSIVAGLFSFTIFVTILHWGHSGLAAGCALSLMMLPIIIRASDVVLRLVPASLKEASYALGSGRLRTALAVVLPTARSGLMTAVLLGTARGIGETSPVLLTAGYTKSLNWNPFGGAQVSLPLMVFNLVRSGEPVQIQRGFGAAVVLLSLVLSLFVLARIVGGRPAGVLTPRQQRRRAMASMRLAVRFVPVGGAVAASVVPDRKEPGVRRRLPALLRRATGAAALLTAISLMFLWTAAPRAMASSYVPISGAGSTWSSNALDAWATNVKQLGMRIDYSPTGSSDGRAQFRNGSQDFAVSEIPYGITDQGVTEPNPSRHFAYMPIVAGGTSFMYNLRINGQRVTTLRLSGDTLAGIFTGAITRWNDKAIQADNPSLAMPDRRIVVVVRSDGSGTTAQLSTWLSKRHQAQWDAYCGRAGRNAPCGVTSFYPIDPGNPFNAQSGSLGVSGFVAQDANEGSITYVEYSYARNSGFPVAKMLNAAHYYVEPTAPAVAVALTAAQINSDLTQNLGGVYDNPDPRAYPLSSYSYMILPTAVEDGFTTDKGHTLGDFAYYFLCKGQKLAPDLGYSPLPINLVQAGFAQIRKVPGVVAQNITIANCDNPTFSNDGSNTLAKTAPYPPACDKQGGPVQCNTGTGGAPGPGGGGGTGGTGGNGGTGGSGGTGGNGTAGGNGGSAGGSGNPQAVGASAGGGNGTSANAAVDPGLVGGGDGGSGGGGQTVNAESVALGAGISSTFLHVLMALSAVLLGAVIVVPPVIARRMSRGRWPR